jgi:hypothetical protein
MRLSRLALVAGLALSAPALADDLYVLVGNTSPFLQKLDPATGNVLDTQFITGHEALFGGLGVDSSGSLHSIDGYNDANPDRLFRIDAATGAGTVVGPTQFNWNFRCITLNPATGQLIGFTDNAIYTMNPATGEATPVANVSGGGPQLDQIASIAIDASGRCFGADLIGTDLFELNLATGAATFIGSIGGDFNWFTDMAFDSAGVLHGARLNGGVYTIDTSAATITFKFGGSYTGLVFTGAPAPVCYPNCDNSTTAPILNVQDFGCFLNAFASGDSYANCDNSTTVPILNVQDFGCFLNSFAAGCT